MLKRPLVITAVLSALALSVAACGGDSGGTTKGGADLIKDGTLTVCSDVPYPPFEDFDKSSPSGFTGFDIDIVSELAKRMILKLAVKDEGFDGAKSGLTLNSGACDLVASVITLTPDREKALDF